MIDSHAHLTFSKDFDEDIIKRAISSNIKKIINICLNEKSLEEGFLLEKKYDFIKTASATHPHDVEKEKDFFYTVKKYIKKLIAIGETGLDYFYKNSSKSSQKKSFEKYLNLANEYNLPLIIHSRDAFSDICSILKSYKKKVVFHCFTGNIMQAEYILDKKWYISFSGIITFNKSEELQKVVKMVPIDKILIETDSPFLAPGKYRGKKNEPSFLIETARQIAFLKNLPIEEVIKITTKTTEQFFSIKS